MSIPIDIVSLRPPVSPRQHAGLFELYGELTTKELVPADVRERIDSIVGNAHQGQFVAEQAGHIVGTATFTLFDIPTSRKGFIDDVVVTRAVRGQGVARSLLTPILDLADASHIDLQLTSSDLRPGAVALYKKLGFDVKDTNFMVRPPQYRG